MKTSPYLNAEYLIMDRGGLNDGYLLVKYGRIQI